MTISYKFVKDIFTNQHCGILCTEDGITCHIPFDEANTDYQAYLLWVSEGGVAEAAD